MEPIDGMPKTERPANIGTIPQTGIALGGKVPVAPFSQFVAAAALAAALSFGNNFVSEGEHTGGVSL